MKIALTSVASILFVFATTTVDAQSESWLSRLWNRGPGRYERMHESVLKAFRPVSEQVSHCTAEIRTSDDKAVIALGTIVDADGLIVTKSSQLPKEKSFECRLKNGKEYAAEVLRRDTIHDLALIKIAATGLTPIEWNVDESPAVGSWVMSCYTGDLPLAVGVVSVDSRKVGPNRAFLGIRHSGANYKIDEVIANSAAEAAGIKVGDQLKIVNGRALDDPDDLTVVLSVLQPGAVAKIQLERDGESILVEATLKEREPERARGRRGSFFSRRLEGDLSTRRTSFPTVLQHDTVLLPSFCGGPLIDLDGKAVGINIARAGRVNSYAVPAPTVLDFVADSDPVDLASTSTGLGAARIGKLERDLAGITETVTLMRRLIALEDQITRLEAELVAARGEETETITRSLAEARKTAEKVRTSLDR